MKLVAMGIEVADGEFSGSSRFVLRSIGWIPGGVTERVLFGDLPGAVFLQKALQRFVAGPRFVRVHFTAGPLEGWDFDCFTAERYFVLGARYEHKVTQTLLSLVRRGDVVYDIGAHAGYSALVFARLSGDGLVYAFEPSPATFQRLRHNVELNGVKTVTPVNAGVWDREGSLRLAENGSWSRVVDDATEVDLPVSEIGLLRLDDFVYRDGHPPATLVKIDVEGNAARSLAGARELLSRARPHVLLELHHQAEERESIDILRRHRYSLRLLGGSRRYPYHALGSPR